MKKFFLTFAVVLLALCPLFSRCAPEPVTQAEQGAAWHTGTGLPSEAAGTAGDHYLDLDTGSVYEKTADGWTLRGTLRPSVPSETVTVTFDAGEGRLPDGDPREVTLPKGSGLALPVPVREGYRFLGWFYGEGANGGQATDLTVFARDVLLTARWQKLHVLRLESGQRSVTVGEGFSFSGDYDGKEPKLTLFVERSGVRTPVEETDLVTQPVLRFNAENGTLNGVLSFCEAGEFRIVLVAEEDGTAVEASLAVSVRAEGGAA